MRGPKDIYRLQVTKSYAQRRMKQALSAFCRQEALSGNRRIKTTTDDYDEIRLMNDEVSLNQHLELSDGRVIPKNSEGIVIIRNNLLEEYQVDFEKEKGVWVADYKLN